MTLRTLARAAAKWLPRSSRARLAQFRFGYAEEGHRFDFAVTGDPGAPVVTIDGRIRLKLRPDALGSATYQFVTSGDSRNEMQAFMTVSAALPPGALLMDVGASQGLFGLMHCALNPLHRALLLEPSPSAAATAVLVLADNGFADRTEVMATGAAARRTPYHVVEDALGFAQIVDAGTPGAAAVDFVAIDEECERRGEMPAVIKIDVEGAEADVLRGAERVVRTARPILFLELHLDVLEQRGESLGPMLAALDAQGYAFHSVGGRRLSRQSIERSLRGILRIVARYE